MPEACIGVIIFTLFEKKRILILCNLNPAHASLRLSVLLVKQTTPSFFYL